MSPSGGWSSALVAPTKASRASSSSLSTSTDTPARSAIARVNSSWLEASRIAAVATARIVSVPSSRASRTWVATTSTTSAIFFAGIVSSRRRPLAIRVNARWRSSSRSRPSAGSATSSRVVFEPMSMQPQIIRSGYRLAGVAGTLWLLRHGDAEPHGSGPDFERRLTARGEQQARAAGRALARMGVSFERVFTSPRVRALDTAPHRVRRARRRAGRARAARGRLRRARRRRAARRGGRCDARCCSSGTSPTSPGWSRRSPRRESR